MKKNEDQFPMLKIMTPILVVNPPISCCHIHYTAESGERPGVCFEQKRRTGRQKRRVGLPQQ